MTITLFSLYLFIDSCINPVPTKPAGFKHVPQIVVIEEGK